MRDQTARFPLPVLAGDLSSFIP